MWKKFVNHFWIGGEFVLKVGRKIDSQRQIFFPLHCILFTVRTTRKKSLSIILLGKKSLKSFYCSTCNQQLSIIARWRPNRSNITCPCFSFSLFKKNSSDSSTFPTITDLYIYIYTRIMFQLSISMLNCRHCNTDLITNRSWYMHRSMLEHL